MDVKQHYSRDLKVLQGRNLGSKRSMQSYILALKKKRKKTLSALGFLLYSPAGERSRKEEKNGGGVGAVGVGGGGGGGTKDERDVDRYHV